jgi:hypothetical protein
MIFNAVDSTHYSIAECWPNRDEMPAYLNRPNAPELEGLPFPVLDHGTTFAAWVMSFLQVTRHFQHLD